MPDPDQAAPGRRAAAPQGVIVSTPIEPGNGSDALPASSRIPAVRSSVLGDNAGEVPPAHRKPDPDAASRPAHSGVEAPHETAAAPVAGGGADMAPSHARPVVVRKTGFWPVFLGGLVAAGLGSAATIWALPYLPEEWRPAVAGNPPLPAPAIDLAAIRAEAVAAAQAAAAPAAEEAAARQIAALSDELAAQPAPEPAVSPEDLAALREQLGQQAQQIADLQAEVAAQPAPEPAVSPEELAVLRDQLGQQARQIADLQARPQIDPATAGRIETLAGQAEALEQQIQTAAEAAQAQITEAQAAAEVLQEAAAESTRRAEAVAALAALQSALDRGVSPDEARQTLEGAGLDTPEALTREVPGLESLRAGFPDAARAALRAALRQDSAAGNGNIVSNFLRAQTGARSVAPRAGSDPDAILSRADAAVAEGRIADALTEIEALPEPARAAPAMADWVARAAAYRDAQAALSGLSAPAN